MQGRESIKSSNPAVGGRIRNSPQPQTNSSFLRQILRGMRETVIIYIQNERQELVEATPKALVLLNPERCQTEHKIYCNG